MAVNSSTEVCNLALDLLSAAPVTDVENPSDTTEEILSRWYDLTRKKVLRAHPWNFATKRIALAASATAPAFGYEKSFTLPADFVRVLYIERFDTFSTSSNIMPHQFYTVEGGSVLLKSGYGDSTTLNLVYVCDFKDVPRMDSMFIDLLAHELALSVAFKVTESNTNIQRISQLKDEAARIAKAVDGQENPPIRIERSSSIRARRSGSSIRSDIITW